MHWSQAITFIIDRNLCLFFQVMYFIAFLQTGCDNSDYLAMMFNLLMPIFYQVRYYYFQDVIVLHLEAKYIISFK